MEAQEESPPPYSDVFPDSNSFHVENEIQSNQFNIAPRETILPQPNAQVCLGVSSNTVVLNQREPVLVHVHSSKGGALTWSSVAVCLCCCSCTGIFAISYASQAQRDYKAGNLLEAEKNQNLARRWMIISVFASVAVWIPCVILFFAELLPGLIGAEPY